MYSCITACMYGKSVRSTYVSVLSTSTITSHLTEWTVSHYLASRSLFLCQSPLGFLVLLPPVSFSGLSFRMTGPHCEWSNTSSTAYKSCFTLSHFPRGGVIFSSFSSLYLPLVTPAPGLRWVLTSIWKGDPLGFWGEYVPRFSGIDWLHRMTRDWKRGNSQAEQDTHIPKGEYAYG